jgi:ATP-dependent exoDNAse (exonuclease V) beta subunit
MTKAFNVLDPNQEIFGNFFIEASAGTGKTFTIAHLVLRLILQSPQPLPMKEFCVVTFTKAAASELKKRIKDLLKETKNSIKNKTSDFLFGLSQEDALYRVELALFELDQAQISTLHGLCYSILKKNALDFDLPLDLQNPEDSSMEGLCYDIIKAVLNSQDLDQPLCKTQKAILIGSMQGDLHRLILHLRQKLLSGIELEPVPSWRDLIKDIECAIESLGSYPGNDAILNHV